MSLQKYGEISGERADLLIASLKDWYGRSRRDLVWRRTRDPYAIWVSEIMAQQTRITAVLPYYERFTARFPTVFTLAEASADDVLKMWEGLGYYSRAHNLSRTAKIIVSEYGGLFPDDPTRLQKLPGVGPYTAGAIAAICFDCPVPAVDGNVLRVFSRLENNAQDIGIADTKKSLTAFLRAIIPAPGAGVFNQALMELGALVCLPKNPLCEKCPVRRLCEACRLGKQDVLPVKGQKKPLKQVDLTILLIIGPAGKILVRKREEKLLNGLWEFYCLYQSADEEDICDRLRTLGYMPVSVTDVGSADHTFTHMKWHMRGFHCQVEEAHEPEGFRFADISDVRKLAMPAAIRYFREWFFLH